MQRDPQHSPDALPEQEAQPPADENADTPFDHPEHRLVNAADTAPVQTKGVRSIWDIAAGAKSEGFAMAMVLAEMPAERAGPKPWAATVSREAGSTHVVGAQYPSNRWSDERTQQLRDRQAEFKPPRPAKGSRTRGKKVRAWDGEGME